MAKRRPRGVTAEDRQRREQQRQDTLAALHDRLIEQVRALSSGEDWRRWLEIASRLRTYSFRNTLLILAQKPDSTAVAGYQAWRRMGRQVAKGEKGIQILAPIVRRRNASVADPAEDEPATPTPAPTQRTQDEDITSADPGPRRLVGFRLTHVWDISQTTGNPVPEPPRPALLHGQAPDGLWDALAAQATTRNFTVERGDCRGANGYTDFRNRTIRVRDDIDDAQASKTLLHDPLTALTGRCGGVTGWSCGYGAPVMVILWEFFRFLCSGRFDGLPRAGNGMEEKDQDRASSAAAREVTRLLVPTVGRVARIDESPGTVLLDASDRPVAEVSEFFASMLASGASASSLRSYALALLRWWRFLAAVEVPWERASRVEARDFVLWMRLVGPAERAAAGGYAPATINHCLAVVKTFYADRMSTGTGPLVNPIPDAAGRAGRRVQAHHNPMAEFTPGRRAPLRQKLPERVPRSLPDHLFDALFAAMRSDRDRALLPFYVSTGTRASELLGVTVDRVDPGEQRIGVCRKGSGRLQWLPASADAFVWLRLYEQHAGRPDGERALWLTRRHPVRPLTYSAARRMLQRANESLATEWTLHDLRHTAAQRMIDDPGLSLSDVQWVLGHAHLTTTQQYLRPRPAEVIARVLDHHRTRDPRPPAPPGGAGYQPEILDVLLAGGAHV